MSVAPQVIRNAKYLPIKVAEARLIDLTALTLNSYFESTELSPYLVWLRQLAVTRNANVWALISGTVADRRYEDRLETNAMPVLDDYLELNVPFDFDTRIELMNRSVAAINNYQARVIYEIQDYSVADKIALGKNLESDEQTIADRYQIAKKVKTGELPMPRPKGSLYYRYSGNYTGNLLAVTGEVVILDRTIPKRFKGVLTGLWCNHPPINFGDLSIQIYVDDALYLTLYPYMFPNYATTTRWILPLDLWVTGIKRLKVTILTASNAAGVGATAEAVMDMREQTIWDKIAWGLDKDSGQTSKEELQMIEEYNLRDKLKAGLYTLLTPVKNSV